MKLRKSVTGSRHLLATHYLRLQNAVSPSILLRIHQPSTTRTLDCPETSGPGVMEQVNGNPKGCTYPQNFEGEEGNSHKFPDIFGSRYSWVVRLTLRPPYTEERASGTNWLRAMQAPVTFLHIATVKRKAVFCCCTNRVISRQEGPECRRMKQVHNRPFYSKHLALLGN
jgi:hypothetical protein